VTGTGSPFQLATVLELVADAVPEREAVVTEDRILTYAALDERATRLANHLAGLGVVRGDRVGVHAANCTEWVEAFYACCKLGAAPVNVNQRYVADELRHLYGDADCVAAIVGEEFVDRLDAVAGGLPGLRHRLVIGSGYEAALAAASPQRAFEGRSGDDLYLIYTGGTTGLPKGVMWRHEDLIFGALNAIRGNQPADSPEQFAAEAAASANPLRLMALGPMMHGGGQWVMGNAHLAGGTFILYTGTRFDPAAVWGLAARARANTVSTIGDAMARPLAEALAVPGHPDWDLSALFSIGNGGAPLSASVRAQLTAVLPNVLIRDAYGASETGTAGSRFDGGEGFSAPRFEVGPDTTVLDELGRPCGVGQVGMLARSGHIPLGYWNDPVKTAATFREVDGVRWVLPGDFARIEDDGSVSVLGRGSVCINTGGEKVYPEEVEAALKHHPAILDAVVVGVPHERWGEQVTALVELRPGHEVTADDVRADVRQRVADYKVPKAVHVVDQVVRTPVGKADYVWAKATASAAEG
jgi:3-oxocholest-4-en-26-oate---CoA ligase